MHFGPLWAFAILGVRLPDSGVTPPFIDARRWLSGIYEQLMPQALVDPSARDDLVGLAGVLQNMYQATGDTEIVARLTRVTEGLGITVEDD